MTKKQFSLLLTQLTALAASYSADFYTTLVNAFTPLAEKYGIEFNPAPAPATPAKVGTQTVRSFGRLTYGAPINVDPSRTITKYSLVANPVVGVIEYDDARPMHTVDAIPFSGVLANVHPLYGTTDTYESYIAGEKWHMTIPRFNVKDEAALLNTLRQITSEDYHVSQIYRGEFGELQEYCKGANGLDILKWYAPIFSGNQKPFSGKLIHIVFFRDNVPIALLNVSAPRDIVNRTNKSELDSYTLRILQEYLGLI